MTLPHHAAGGQPQLARRLRELRLHTWPGRTVTQRMLAEALGGRKPLSLSLISAWENETSSTVPPTARLHQYATFFATERSVADDQVRLVPETELTPTEIEARDDLFRELLALREGRTAQPVTTARSVRFDWTYPRGASIRIVCGKLDLDGEPAHPYTDPTNPNYTDLLTFADIDALVELFGHLWRLNPDSDIRFIRADRLAAAAEVKADRLTSHVVLLGGIGVNQLTQQVFSEARLPIGQIERPDITDQGEIFELDGTTEFTPKWSDGLLVEDVGLFARLPNPYNSRTTLTICNGVFAPGVLGAVRALTDNQLREQNESYLESRFAGADRFAILMRVPVALGTALTPDLQKESTRLYEWSEDAVPENSDGQGRSE